MKRETGIRPAVLDEIRQPAKEHDVGKAILKG